RLGALRTGRIEARHAHAALIGPHQPEQQLDQGGLAGPVVADQRGGLAGAQRQADVAHGDDIAIAPGHAAPLRDRAHRDACPAIAGGRISGALSTTPPGYRAGNRACAHRTICTAGLLTSTLACGSVHRISSITSLGRYGRSAIPSPSRS